MRTANRITDEKIVITRVKRYVDINKHIGRTNPDTGEKKGLPQRMYAVWMQDMAGDTMVSFVKRCNKGGLAQAVRDGMDEVYGGRIDDQEFDLGMVIGLKSAIIKKRYPAGEHKGEFLPERDVLTHVVTN